MKISQLERAIAQLESEIQILELAVTKLRQQRDSKPARVRAERKPKLAAVEKGGAA